MFPLLLVPGIILNPPPLSNACRFGPERVSYMKPVGQKHVMVKGKDGEDLKVLL